MIKLTSALNADWKLFRSLILSDYNELVDLLFLVPIEETNQLILDGHSGETNTGNYRILKCPDCGIINPSYNEWGNHKEDCCRRNLVSALARISDYRRYHIYPPTAVAAIYLLTHHIKGNYTHDS